MCVVVKVFNFFNRLILDPENEMRSSSSSERKEEDEVCYSILKMYSVTLVQYL